MADIIPLHEKLQHVKDKKALAERKRKLLAARSVLQQSKGTYRCEKCLDLIDPSEIGSRDEHRKLRVPYIFCDVCFEEYIDFVDQLQGRVDADRYWQNDIWLEGWKRWIDYRGTMDRYLRSPEFRRLLEELKQPDPY